MLFVAAMAAWNAWGVSGGSQASAFWQFVWSSFWVAFWALGTEWLVRRVARSLGCSTATGWVPFVAAGAYLLTAWCIPFFRSHGATTAVVAWLVWCACWVLSAHRIPVALWRSSRFGVWFVVLLSLGALVRLYMLVGVPYPFLKGDTLSYCRFAMEMIESLNPWLNGYRTPLYGVFVWGAMRAFGPDYLSVVVVQHALGLVQAVLVYGIVFRLSSGRRWPALVAMAACLFSRTLVFAEHTILADSVFPLFAVAFLWLAVRRSRMDAMLVLSMVLCVGAMVLVRPPGLYMLAVLSGWVLLRFRAAWWRRATVLCVLWVLVGLVLLGWSGVNRARCGFFGVTRTGGWVPFYTFSYLIDFESDALAEFKEAVCESVRRVNEEWSEKPVLQQDTEIGRMIVLAGWDGKPDRPSPAMFRYFVAKSLPTSERQAILRGLVIEGILKHQWAYLAHVAMVLETGATDARLDASYFVGNKSRPLNLFCGPEITRSHLQFALHSSYDTSQRWLAWTEPLRETAPNFGWVYSAMPSRATRCIWYVGAALFLLLTLAAPRSRAELADRLLLFGTGAGYLAVVAATVFAEDRFFSAIDPFLMACMALALCDLARSSRARWLALVGLLVSVIVLKVGREAGVALAPVAGNPPLGMSLAYYQELADYAFRRSVMWSLWAVAMLGLVLAFRCRARKAPQTRVGR